MIGQSQPLQLELTAAARVCGHRCDATPLHGICDVPKANNLFAGGCFAMTAEQVDAFPSVSVTLKGTKPLALKGSDYLIAHPSKDGAYCLGIQSSGYDMDGYGVYCVASASLTHTPSPCVPMAAVNNHTHTQHGWVHHSGQRLPASLLHFL